MYAGLLPAMSQPRLRAVPGGCRDWSAAAIEQRGQGTKRCSTAHYQKNRWPEMLAECQAAVVDYGFDRSVLSRVALGLRGGESPVEKRGIRIFTSNKTLTRW